MIPTIEASKKSLEEKIIHLSGVFGIGVVLADGHKVIEVAVENESVKTDILQRLSDNKWEGHPVTVIIREQTKLYT